MQQLMLQRKQISFESPYEASLQCRMGQERRAAGAVTPKLRVTVIVHLCGHLEKCMYDAVCNEKP